MPAFTKKEKPVSFDDDVATHGNAWLAANSRVAKRPPTHWNKKAIKKKLRENFGSLCGYTLMHEMRGTVDHYISWKSDRSKAYDWGNYRFCAGAVNSSKQNADDTVFDPYDIEFEWFEILLPSMIMKVRDCAPGPMKAKLSFTLTRLPIADTDEVIDYRAEYYEGYKQGEMSLDWIYRKIPVLASSIEAWHQANPGCTSADLP